MELVQCLMAFNDLFNEKYNVQLWHVTIGEPLVMIYIRYKGTASKVTAEMSYLRHAIFYECITDCYSSGILHVFI